MALPAALRSNANFQIKLGYEFLDNMSSLSVRFENPRDGWISGSMTGRVVAPGVSNGIINLVVWSTHNGGVTWSPSALPELDGASTFFDLESSATAVYVLGVVAKTNRTVVDYSPVGVDRWMHSSLAPMSLPAGGSFPYGAITLAGTHGWLTEGNDRGATGSAQLNLHGQWVPWRAPCASVGDTLAFPQASSPTHLTVACQIGGFGDSPVAHKPPGAAQESTWIYVSSNGGASFQPGPEIGKTFGDSAAIFAAPSPSTMFADKVTTSTYLTASFDGGSHWSRVFHGAVTSLTFVTPTVGFGFVGVSNSKDEIIETVDGGHAWSVLAD